MTDIVHCLFVAVDSANKLPLVINFSKAYEVSFPSTSVVSITRNLDPYTAMGLKDAGVAGIAVLYGVNGAGKTGAMIDVANAFGDNPRARTAGGLIERDGILYLRKGKALQGFEVTGEPGISIAPEDDLHCLSLFYTSSPFDTGRLGRLRNNGLARDVSPVYGERNAFDGLSLLEIRSALNMPFVERGEISVRLRVATVSNSLTALTNRLGRSGHPHTPIVRGAVSTAARNLSLHEQMQFRCWLSLFVAVLERDDRPIPEKFVKLLDAFPNSMRPLQDLFALWKVIIQTCHKYMGMQVMIEVMKLLQHLSKPKVGKLIGKKYTPAQLDAVIKQDFERYRESMRQCIELGLLEFTMSKLSSGEMAYAMIFSSLYGGLRRVSRTGSDHPVLILLDEGEMFLHPQWQREYIARLLDFAKEIPELKGRLYFVLATHSLIVAADAPPQSLINVATGKQENGFGLGPRSTLTDIYKVKVFHGEYSESEFKRIHDFIREPRLKTYRQVRDIAASVADRHSKEFLVAEIDEALERSGE